MKWNKNSILLKMAISIGIAIFFGFIVRIFFFQTFEFSGNSMGYTITNRQKVFINQLSSIKNDDLVVFHHPQNSKKQLKRCIASSGDTLQIKNKQVIINHKKEKIKNSYLYDFKIITAQNTHIKTSKTNFRFSDSIVGVYIICLSENEAKVLKNNSLIRTINHTSTQKCINYFEEQKNQLIRWNKDNYGPIIIPKKGMTVNLNNISYTLYKSIIESEGNTIERREKGVIYVNNKPIKMYQFQANYYFMMNDYRDNDEDSRSFGFVSEKNIIGKVLFTLFEWI